MQGQEPEDIDEDDNINYNTITMIDNKIHNNMWEKLYMVNDQCL